MNVSGEQFATGAGSWAQAYASYLPRPPEDFSDGSFAPLTPIRPMPVDRPPPGFDRAMPRRWQPTTGWNLPQSPPGSEGYKLTDFATLRSLSRLYSVARSCIQLLKAEIRGLEWDVVPTKDALKAMRNDHAAMADFGKRRQQAVRFFKNPDPEYGSWSSWIDTLLEDVYSVDALAVYLRPSRVRGRGLMGSDLAALELINGTSIRPLFDVHGSRPSPPSPAWQQYIFGVPRTDLMTIISGNDIPDDLRGAKVQEYRGDQLLYLPYLRATDSPYGCPPIEQALVPVMAGLSKQGFQLDFFREGSLPAAYISPGDAAMTASQVRELQEALNTISGDVGFKHKIIVLPPGSKVEPQKTPALADAFDQIIATEVAMAFMVQPMELGLMPQVSVSQSPSAVNQAAKSQSAIHQRKSLVPMLQFLKQGLLDKIIQIACGQTDMQFMWAGLEEDEDEVALTNLLVSQVGGGLASVDEARAELGRDPWGLPVTSDPLWASANGVMLLGSVDPVTGQPGGQQAALPSPQSVSPEPTSAPGGNEGQVNPRAALAQGHMPGTTHVPPAQPNRPRTPSHSAAVAGAAEAAAAASGSSSKAVLSELDALARHVRKGRDPATWQAVHIPGVVLASICEDVTKGLGAAQVITDAAAGFLPKLRHGTGGQPPVSDAGVMRLAWDQDEALARRYEALIAAAFAAVRKEAEALFAAFLAGTLAVTAATLASMIADLIRDRLALILAQLRAEAYDLGQESAQQAAGQQGQRKPVPPAAPLPGAAGMAQLAQQAAIRQMSATGMAGLAGALAKALAGGGVTVGVLLALLDGFLSADRRAWLIAISETTRAIGEGALDAYLLLGVAYLRWVTRNDGKVCAVCMSNQAAGPIPAGSLFPGGVASPLQHPQCRCRLLAAEPPVQPAALPPAIGKAAEDWDWKHPDTSLPVAEQVYRQMLEDFPPEAIEWVRRAKWTGPEQVALSRVVWQPEKWRAGHEPDRVDHFTDKIRKRVAKGKMGHKPAILVRRENPDGARDLYAVDGHHRLMADSELGRPADAYTGIVAPGDVRAASGTHSSQFRSEKSAGGYSVSPRSGMISLDLPDGLIEPLPGGVDDHHVTIVYLGKDVDDEALRVACDTARRVAAGMQPLSGTVGGIGSFPAGEDGVPVWAGVNVPGIDALHQALRHLQSPDAASAKTGRYAPHMTLAYLSEGDPLPDPLPHVPVTFTHLSVHRGGEVVARYPFGGER